MNLPYEVEDLDDLPSFVGYAHYGESFCESDAPVTYIMAGNGIFKRGHDEHLDIIVPYIEFDESQHIPGLDPLRASVIWKRYPCAKMPGQLLEQVYLHARQQEQAEFQYQITYDPGNPMFVNIHLPKQDTTAVSIRYDVTPGVPILVDLHSHHNMSAYFSATDDHDDLGLSVSVVIGRLRSIQPEIVARLNCWGTYVDISPWEIFTNIYPFEEAGDPEPVMRTPREAYSLWNRLRSIRQYLSL